MNNILIVDDEKFTIKIVKDMLINEGFNVFIAQNHKEALDTVGKENIDLVYLDIKMPEVDGLATLKMLKEKDTYLPVVMLTADDNVGTAVNAIKLGAEDYITKDKESIEARLLLTTRNILKANKLSKEVNDLRNYLKNSVLVEPIIYKSKIMEETINLAEKAAGSDITILIIGESGTGKELFSKYIHFKSKRAGKPLIAIDCAMLPENLVESELFGYERGAFTGANNRKLGRIELANEGTLFLDEVGNLTADVQRKLLRFLEEKTIERLGGKEPIKVNVRLIAATNVNLKEAVKNKTFREDLFYRLNVFVIDLPPLRERKADIPLLYSYFVERFSKEHRKKLLSVSKDVVRLLESYPWPGNIRELRNVMERASLLADKEILPEHLPRGFSSEIDENLIDGNEVGLLDIGKKAASEAEKKYLIKVLNETNGNKSKAAKKMKIDYKTLFNKLKEYGISAFIMLFCFLSLAQEKISFNLVEGFPLEVDSQFSYSSPLFCDINKDGEEEIVSACKTKVYIVNKRGNNLEGWPVSIQASCESDPAVSDIDGDGIPEVVVISKVGPDILQIYVFDKDGKDKFGFPIKMKGMTDIGSSPVLADLDQDGTLEIIFSATVVTSNNTPNIGIVYVIKKDGLILPGWPQIVAPESTGSEWLSTPVIADINKDNVLEIVVASISGKVYVWQPNGFMLKGWPQKALDGDVFYVRPEVADVDNDDKLEIIIGSCNNAQAGNMYVWRSTGELLMGFPSQLKSNIQSVAAVADIDGNGSNELIVGTNLGNKVWVLNSSGEVNINFPVETKGWMCNNPLLVDLDKDKKLEILIGCREPLLYGFYFDGRLLPGFPLELTKEPYIIYRKPAVTFDKEGVPYICYNADRKIFLWKGTKNEPFICIYTG